MNKADVIRRSHPEKLHNQISDKLGVKKSGVIRIGGLPGAGKTILLSQLTSFLNYKGIFPQIISTTAGIDFSVTGFLRDYAEINGLSRLSPGYFLLKQANISPEKWVEKSKNFLRDILLIKIIFG